jgi:tetraacyldisaccharide-1-P 4'-kinase
VEAFRFSDHHAFSDGDIRRITAAGERWSTAALGTTEKDAQRIIASKKMPPALRKRLFQIPITVDFLTPEEREIFLGVLFDAIKR